MESKQQQQKQKQSNVLSNQSQSFPSILCPLCDDYIVKAVVTICGHTYCQICLNQYMLFLDECVQCQQSIRNQRLNYNILLDAFIKEYLNQQEKQLLEDFQSRIQSAKEYNTKKKLKEISVGQKVDVRDADYVWCQGIVTRTMNKWNQKKIKYMVVKYDNNGKKQQFPENSPRIASSGFYTLRTDLPRYLKGELVYYHNSVIRKVPNIGYEEQQKSNSDS